MLSHSSSLPVRVFWGVFLSPKPLTLLVSFDERLSRELIRRGFSIVQQRRSSDLCKGRTDELFPAERNQQSSEAVGKMFVETPKKTGKKTPAGSLMEMWGLSYSGISLCELRVWYLLFTLGKAGFQSFCMFCSFWTEKRFQLITAGSCCVWVDVNTVRSL